MIQRKNKKIKELSEEKKQKQLEKRLAQARRYRAKQQRRQRVLAGEAKAFHDRVFARYGGAAARCSACLLPGATEAAHVVGRAHLGRHRYADERLARPLHHACHVAIDTHRAAWPPEILAEAMEAYRALLVRVKVAGEGVA